MMISFQLPELIARATRQKASADAMLNTAMTQQLEGVSRGLESLQESLDTVQQVHTQYEALQHGLADVPGLVGRLHDIQEENKSHIQLRTAMKNIKSIILLPDTIAQTNQLIEEGNLFMVMKIIIYY